MLTIDADRTKAAYEPENELEKTSPGRPCLKCGGIGSSHYLTGPTLRLPVGSLVSDDFGEDEGG